MLLALVQQASAWLHSTLLSRLSSALPPRRLEVDHLKIGILVVFQLIQQSHQGFGLAQSRGPQLNFHSICASDKEASGPFQYSRKAKRLL